MMTQSAQNVPELITLADVGRRLLLPPRKASQALAGGLLRPVAILNGTPIFEKAAIEALRGDMAIACLRQRDPRGRKSAAAFNGANPGGSGKVAEVREQPPTGERGS